MTVGERIKAAREDKGITQGELAKAAHTTKQTIYKYESGIVTNIPYDKMVAISDFLGVSGSYLMGWEGLPSFDETRLLDCYKRLNPDNADKLLRYADALLETQAVELEIDSTIKKGDIPASEIA